MQLSPGDRLGTFQILAKLGQGGMGEVYRAHDSKLGRDVAIKILPDAFVKDPVRLARFEREARTLASLNHPNLAQVFDFATGPTDASTGSAPPSYLVMELVDGDDLSAVAARGAVPVGEAIGIAQQIAAGLAAAHEIGIIHRDLKPANVKVRPDGTVKVLDFGLAKAMDPSGTTSGSLANSPTITSPATEMGVILGTAAYMSPEQARGKVVDRRADVWALGVVLYEMLTGRRAFAGSEVSDVLASVLKDPIDWSALPADTPASIRRLLKRCLEKDRTQRLDSMTAARLELAEAATGGGDQSGVMRADASGAHAQPALRRTAIVGLALLAAGLAIGAFAGPQIWRSETTQTGRVVEFMVPMPDIATGVAITPDGTRLVFESGRLYVRDISGRTPKPLAGTEGARNVFISPDGKWAGFYAGGQIKKVALAGGDTLSLVAIDSDSPGAGWGPDNTVLYSSGWTGQLFSVSADGGGKPKSISTLDSSQGELGHWWPDMLPDGKTVLFTIWTAGSGINDSRLGLLDLTTGKHRVLMPGAFGRYSRSGHIMYFHAGEYHVVPFDAASLALKGDSVKLDLAIVPQDPLGTRQKTFSISTDGTLAYLAGRLTPEDQLSWLSVDGKIEPLPIKPFAFQSGDLSPDGRELIVAVAVAGKYGLYRQDLQRPTFTRIDLPGSNFSPAWSPDGSFLAFTTLRAGHFDVHLYKTDESREQPWIAEPLDQDVNVVLDAGKRVILQDYFADGSVKYSIAEIDQPKQRKPLRIPSETDGLVASPDGKWLALQIIPSGRFEISVMPLGATGPVVPVSTQGGRVPYWSKKTSTLYYRRDEGIAAVSYSTAGGRFAIQKETLVARLAHSYIIGEAPDGRLLIGTNIPDPNAGVHAIVNWFQTLKR